MCTVIANIWGKIHTKGEVGGWCGIERGVWWSPKLLRDGFKTTGVQENRGGSSRMRDEKVCAHL